MLGWGCCCWGTFQAEFQRELHVAGSTVHDWLLYLLIKAGKITGGLFGVILAWEQEWQQCCALDGMLWWEGGLGWGGCWKGCVQVLNHLAGCDVSCVKVQHEFILLPLQCLCALGGTYPGTVK